MGNEARGILLGGGYGLYLKQLHLAEAGVRTLISADLCPAPRATEDLDLMLSAELVADARSMTAIRAALDKLQYRVVAGSEFLLFVRTITATQRGRIDRLTATTRIIRTVTLAAPPAFVPLVEHRPEAVADRPNVGPVPRVGLPRERRAVTERFKHALASSPALNEMS